MAREIKWRIQFKSLNETGCLVNIYEEGYTSSFADTTKTGADVPFAVETGVKELIGASNPFDYQEDDDNNLLSFIRLKTGYIRVIEEAYGELNDLYPTSIRQHYVEAFYGTERVFSGYMQCQQFDNGWVQNPRELEFPVISPLGLLESFKFGIPEVHGLQTMGSLMNYLLKTLNPSADGKTSDYADVIYPGDSTYSPWNQVISTIVMCPFNDGFKHYNAPGKIYAPRDLKYFVDGICSNFGWIVHDTPSSLVFTKYDYKTDGYSRLTYAGLKSLNSGLSGVQQLATSFNSYYSNSDDNAVQSMVMPLKQITLKMEGANISEKRLSTKLTYMLFTDAMYGGSSYRGVALRPNGPDVDGKDIGKATFNSGGNLVDAGLFPVAYGKIEQGATSVGVAEAWYVKYSSAWGDGTALIKAKFFGAPPMDSHGYSLLKIQIERGQNMQSLQATGYADIPLGLIILIDGKYYDANYENLHDDYTINSVTISGQSGKIVPNKTLNNTPGYEDCDVDGFFIKIGYAMARTIEVRLVCFQTSSLSDNEILKISEISLNDPGRIDEQFNRYYEYLDDTIVIDGNSAGIYSEDISINFNNYSMSRGDHAFGVKGNGPIADYPTYPYMFQPLTVLQQKVRRSSLPNFNEYAALWTYWINGWRWRMIAKSFRMRDDEYTVTLARSITLE